CSARQQHVDVVLIRPAPHRQDHRARVTHLDHLVPELGLLARRRATEAEETVAALHPDARRRAAAAHAAYREALVVLPDVDPEEPPGEIVGARRREDGEADRDLGFVVVAPTRQPDAVALAVIPDALLELVPRVHFAAVDPGDGVATLEAGFGRGAV